jgi:hypothetical protein
LIITLDVLPFQFEFGAVLFNSTISLADINGMKYHSIYFKEFYTWSNIQFTLKKISKHSFVFFFKALASMDGIIKYFEEYGLDLSLIE